MDTRRIVYLLATGFFCLAVLPGAVLDIVQPQMVVDTMAIIGLPMYVLVLIGVWKLLGVAGLVFPRFKTINEWAYAGFFFDLTGASYVHAAGGDSMSSIVVPLVFLVPLTASYLARPAARA